MLRSTDEISELMQRAQELGRALESSASEMSSFASSAQSALASLSGATETERKNISQLLGELEKKRAALKELKDDYTGTLIVAQNYYKAAQKAGQNTSGLKLINDALDKQYLSLQGILGLEAKYVDLVNKAAEANLKAKSGTESTAAPSISEANLKEDLVAIQDLQAKMQEAGLKAKELGSQLQSAMDQGKMATAEGRKEMTGLVAEFNTASQTYASLQKKFDSATQQLQQGIEAFESSGKIVSTSITQPLEQAVETTRQLDKELSKVRSSVGGATSSSPDLQVNGDTDAMAKKLAKSEEQLNAVFSEQNRILQENRALLSQDQKYMELQAQVATSAEGSVRQMTAQMKLYKMELENLSPATDQNRAAMEALKDNINRLDSAIKQASADQKKHIIDISQYGQTTAYVASDVRRAIQALTQLRVQMAQVDVSTQEGREEFARMTQEYQKLTKQIGDLKRDYNVIKTTTQALGNQAGMLVNTASLISGTTAGVQAFVGMANLAGRSTDEWGQALLKLQSIMAITNGLTQAYNALLKTGRIYQLAETVTLKLATAIWGAKTGAIIADTSATNADTAATIENTEAQIANNAAKVAGTEASTANAVAKSTEAAAKAGETAAKGMAIAGKGAKALGLLLKSGPLLILTAIVTVIALVVKQAVKWRNAWKKPLEVTNQQMKKFNDLLKQQVDYINSLSQTKQKILSFYQRVAEAAHAYYTVVEDLKNAQWEESAKQAMGELKVALDNGLVSIHNLGEELKNLGTDWITLNSEFDSETGMMKYYGNLDLALRQLEARQNEQRKQLKLVNDDLAYYQTQGTLKGMNTKIKFTIDGEKRRMTYKEVIEHIEALKEKLSAEATFTISVRENLEETAAEKAKRQAEDKYEAMAVANMVKQAQHEANEAALQNIEQRFDREKALARENTQYEISQIKYRIDTEQDLGEEGRAALNKKIAALEVQLQRELREIQEAEAQANWEIYNERYHLEYEAEVDSHRKRRMMLMDEYYESVELIDRRLATEQDLTKTEIAELTRMREIYLEKYKKDSLELERELQKELIAAEISRLETKGEIARKGSEEEYQYTKEALLKQMEDELIARQQLTGEERALAASELEIRIKYAKAIAEAEVQYQNNAAQEILEARQRWDKAFFDSKERSVREQAKFEMEQQVEILKAERNRVAAELKMELALIELKLREKQITEEEARAMIAALQPMLTTIDAIDREVQNLIDNWDKELEYSNIWELLGMSKRQASSFKLFIDSLKESLSEALDAWADYYAEKARLAEEDFDEAKSEYEIQQQLRAEGYANSVETARREMEEKRRLRNEALRQEAAAEKAQEDLNAAQAASEMVVAVAKVFKQFGMPLGAIMAGTMVAAFIAARVSAIRAARAKASLYSEGTVEMLEGGSHASGHDISLGYTKDGRERRAEGGEFFAIINKRNSRRYRSVIPDVINSLNDGTFAQRYVSSMDRVGDTISYISTAGGSDLTSLENDVKGIREQGETRSYIDGQGNLVEISKGIIRKTYKR